MITPRRTRLVRVADLHEFRRALASLSADAVTPAGLPQRSLFGAGVSVVVVPTRGAALALRRTLVASGLDDPPFLVTRDQLYDLFHDRLEGAPGRLGPFEREAIAQAAALEAAREVPSLPFQIRPGLVVEILRFYDHLRRQSQTVARFEALVTEALGGGDDADVGAARLLQQTRFLARAFTAYERRVRESGAIDEHTLRERLLAMDAGVGVRSVTVAVADWIADPTGLFVADFDLLARLSGIEALDIVCTEHVLGSGFHERIHRWWPGLDEVTGADTDAVSGRRPEKRTRPARVRPTLIRPPVTAERPSDDLWFTYRDREEELLAATARVIESAPGDVEAWERTAIVYKRPLPYLYLAPDTLAKAGVAFHADDALPLAAEPLASAVDLMLDAVETAFSRESIVALLLSPHLDCGSSGLDFRRSASALNAFLSDQRYLGGVDRLESLAETIEATDPGSGAMRAALSAARALTPLLASAPASHHLGALGAFLDAHWRYDDHTERERAVCRSITRIIDSLRAAHAAFHDPVWTLDDLASAIRHAIEDETFPVVSNERGVHLLDDQAARFGNFDDLTIVGLVENEWPERTRRNVFYAPAILKPLGWPSEKDRRAAADARLLDLLGSASSRVQLSTVLLEDEALVTRSLQLDEVVRAALPTDVRTGASTSTIDREPDIADAWTRLRRARPGDAPEFHGFVGGRRPRPWSVSALETYIGCPFKFFAQHVLKLDEEPDDEEVMDPRRQGQFVHGVFEAFFKEWQADGHRAITAANLDRARSLFVEVVDRALGSLPEGEAGLERTRLLGSPAAAGLGEAVFRMEIERPVPVTERLLEHSLSDRFTFTSADGPRTIELRGKADRVDLLADGTFRIVDYKLGWPPDKGRALQLPIYGLCAEQRLNGYRGQRWTLAEAVYLAFKGPRRVVPLFQADSRDEILAKAEQRLVETVDAIARGDFPPSPDDVFRCETCSYQAVCRKDYVGDI